MDAVKKNFTYDDFYRQAQSSGLLGQFSREDLTLAQKYPEFGMSILNLKRDFSAADTEEKRHLINQAANQLRSSYGGYTAGTNGASYVSDGKLPNRIDDWLDRMQNYGSFSYAAAAPTYQNNYSELQKQLLDEVVNRPDFSWSKENDPQWSPLKKQYLREGERATANALGQASAASAGRPSSYAVAAAGQAGDYYATQLSDMIPQLYQQAYQRYLDDYSMKRQALGDVNTQEQNEYQKYLDELSQYNTDRNFAYGQYLDDYSRMQSTLGALQGQEQTDYDRYHTNLLEQEDRRRYEDETAYNREQDRLNREYQAQRDALDDEWRQREFDYGVGRDAVEDEWRQKEWDYGVGRDAVEDEWRQREWDYNVQQDALDRAARAASGSGGSGSYGSADGADAGVSQSDLDAMLALGSRAQASEYARTHAGSNWEYNAMMDAYDDATGAGASADEGSALDALLAIEDRNAAQKYALENAGSQWQAESYMDLWDAQHGGDTATGSASGNMPTNYFEVLERGAQLGLSDDELREVLTPMQWNEARNSYRNGDKSRPAGQYSTYQEYLEAIFGAIGG